MTCPLAIGERYTVSLATSFLAPPGQGASLIERLFTGISGSQTGGQGVLDVSMSELVQTADRSARGRSASPRPGHRPR